MAMTVDPRKSNYLTPSQETIFAYLGNTRHWRTVYEIARAVGVAEHTIQPVVRHLVRLGIRSEAQTVWWV